MEQYRKIALFKTKKKMQITIFVYFGTPRKSLSNHLRVKCKVGEWCDHVFIVIWSLFIVCFKLL